MTLTLEDRLVEVQSMFNAINRIAGDGRDDHDVADLCDIGVRLLSDAVTVAQRMPDGVETPDIGADAALIDAADEYWEAVKLSRDRRISHIEFCKRSGAAADMLRATPAKTLTGAIAKLRVAMNSISGEQHVEDMLLDGPLRDVRREDHELCDFDVLEHIRFLEAYNGR